MEIISRTRACRVCGNDTLKSVLDLGEQYIIDFLENGRQGTEAPLELVLCSRCSLLQLRHTVSRALMYTRYWYRSGTSPTMIKALTDITESAEKIVSPRPGDIVVDIGANDATLLRTYRNTNFTLVGFEPAKNLVTHAKLGEHIINDFFNAKAYLDAYGDQKARIVTAISMFYDLDDPNTFVSDVKQILSEDGLFIIQMNYLATMLERNTFDNICHEHLEYYSLTSLQFLLDKHGLEIFDVELNDVNGGSFRVYVQHKKYAAIRPISERVQNLERYEVRLGIDTKETYELFGDRIKEIGKKLHQFISSEVERGKRVYVNGASTRGNTVLQFADLDDRLIKVAADRNPEKWGLRMVGSNIPIVSKEEARKAKPDYYLILPYGFLEEIKEEEKAYLESGGKFIVPIPYPRIVTRNSECPI